MLLLRKPPSLIDSAVSAISSSVHTSVTPLTFAYDCCAAMIFFMCSRCSESWSIFARIPAFSCASAAPSLRKYSGILRPIGVGA